MTEQESSFGERKWKRELEIEEAKWKVEKLREDAHRAHDKSNAFHTYVNQATMESANLALRTLILINGGAAIAVLAFLGAVAKDRLDFGKIGDVAHTLRYFAIGVALACAGMAFAYFTNLFMVGIETVKDRTYEHPFVVENAQSRQKKRLNTVFHVFSFVCAMSSLLLFVGGMFAASDKITRLLEKTEHAQTIFPSPAPASEKPGSK